MVVIKANLMNRKTFKTIRELHFLPTLCWQEDKNNVGIWIGWLFLALFIGKKRKGVSGNCTIYP